MPWMEASNFDDRIMTGAKLESLKGHEELKFFVSEHEVSLEVAM